MPLAIAASRALRHVRLGTALTMVMLGGWACSGSAESSGTQSAESTSGGTSSQDAVVLTVYSDYV